MKSVPRCDLVVYDLDGTLVDSAPQIAAAVNAMLADLGLPPRSPEEIRCYIGDGVETLARRAVAGDLEGAVEPTLAERALARLLEHYARIDVRATPLFPGVRDTLSELGALGVRQACLTNKNRAFTEPLLDALDLARHFDLVVCGDDLPRRKPDPAPLRHILARLGVAPERALFVGDSAVDVATARAAGVPVAAVRHGYNHGRPIEAAAPDHLLDDLRQIRRIVCPHSPASRPASPCSR